MNDYRFPKVATDYDREGNACFVVRHPDLDLPSEMFAVYNSETDRFKLNVSGNPKRYKSLDTAGHIALVDSAMFKEAPNSQTLRYGVYRRTKADPQD